MDTQCSFVLLCQQDHLSSDLRLVLLYFSYIGSHLFFFLLVTINWVSLEKFFLIVILSVHPFKSEFVCVENEDFGLYAAFQRCRESPVWWYCCFLISTKNRSPDASWVAFFCMVNVSHTQLIVLWWNVTLKSLASLVMSYLSEHSFCFFLSCYFFALYDLEVHVIFEV